MRYRIDGVLYDVGTILTDYALAVIARIKLIARLDVAEKRIPQDGKLVVARSGKDLDLRVATFPGQYGEKIVIRILDQAPHGARLDTLGLAADALLQMQEVIKRSQGFVVVTGPTGSGKTTTLYALLATISSSEKNIVTLEDPIEYTLEGVTQGQVSYAIGFDFAQGIRALLRQDPDVIMVGEMRDQETAQVALQAALTGHLVVSTLHTTDAVAAVVRLLDMGIPAFLLHAAITALVAQRLVRVLCSCKKKDQPSEAERLFLAPFLTEAHHVYRAVGCARCRQTGYKGRIGIFELLVITPAFREQIQEGTRYEALYQVALQEGMRPLKHDAAQKVIAGMTSIQEVMRVLA